MSITNLACAFAVAVVFTSCCKRSVRAQERSPSGEWMARVTIVDCGALGDDTAVTLQRTRRWFAREKAVVGVVGSAAVGIRWLDAHTLHIYLPQSARERDFADQKVLNRVEEADGIHIEYTQE